ncbi:MAG: hypothetical protein GC192_24315 [Bacteroidetes bacterium]|nr:hypothetical protein [Bacteroidota bacterium]
MPKLPNTGFFVFELPNWAHCPLSNCYAILLLLALSALIGCANPIAPQGGPKDLDPPKLDSLHSTRNFQTHFKKQDIVLAFDEWVELKGVFTQVVISPPLAKRPEIVRKKKTVQLHFADDEVLRDSATYVINFGQAIRDLTEGNVAPIVFVFSTGDYIDSLSVEGQINDAWTGKPVEKTLFMLYENLADSVVRKDRPFYFAMTDKDGKFKVNNVKSGTFKAVALNDLNLNYRFDSDAEQIGFLDSNLVLSGKIMPDTTAQELETLPQDSLQNDSLDVNLDSLTTDTLQRKMPLPPSAPKVNLRLFAEEQALFLRSKEVNKYGQVKLIFNKPPTDAKVSFDSVGQVVVFETDKDTLRLWYNQPVQDISWRVFVQRDTSMDTVLVKTGLRAGFLTTAKLTTAMKQTGQPVKLKPGESFKLAFNYPLANIDAANIRLLEDTSKTVVQPKLNVDSLVMRNLVVNFPWKEGVGYELQVLPGGVTDIYGLSNLDSIDQKITAGQAKDFGTLTLKVLQLDSSKAYVIRLLEKPESPPVKVWTLSNSTSFQAKLEMLAPSTYTVELIEDLDHNGRWTTGSYDLHRQPERVVRKTLEELRANWELEAEVSGEW